MPVILTPDNAMIATIMVGSPSSPGLSGGDLNSTRSFGRCSSRFARSRRERPLISIIASSLIVPPHRSQDSPRRATAGPFNELDTVIARNLFRVLQQLGEIVALR